MSEQRARLVRWCEPVAAVHVADDGHVKDAGGVHGKVVRYLAQRVVVGGHEMEFLDPVPVGTGQEGDA